MQIKTLSDDNNNLNKQSVLDTFDNEPGFYYQVIRSMLAPGHEIELIYWLKSTGLLQQSQKCDNAKINKCCDQSMNWTPAKVVDFYQWKCKSCLQKKSIREGSVFNEIKCSFKNAIRIVLGWCKGIEMNEMAKMLDVTKTAVKALYKIATNTANAYIENNIFSWKLGGPGIIVIIDTYPEGCTIENRLTSNHKPILCLAEVKNIPPWYWFESLDRFNRNNEQQIRETKMKILTCIKRFVLPGSILVSRSDSLLCSTNDLQVLRPSYPIIISVEELSRLDNDEQKIMVNLGTIWDLALDVCEEAQQYPIGQVQNFLMIKMWRRKFGNEAFEVLLNSFSDN